MVVHCLLFKLSYIFGMASQSNQSKTRAKERDKMFWNNIWVVYIECQAYGYHSFLVHLKLFFPNYCSNPHCKTI